MKIFSKITLGTAVVVFTSIMLVSKKKASAKKSAADIANKGYETATDDFKKNKKLKKMHFGPVLPHHNFS